MNRKGRVIIAFTFIQLYANTACNQGNLREKDSALTKRTMPDIENNLKILITRIEASDCVYGAGIGIESRANATYESYDRLNKLISDSEWLNLSYSRSTVMRIYAFKALLERNQLMAAEVRHRLKTDSSTFCYIANDIEYTSSVSKFVVTNE
jgi:hypothetical protein